MTEYVPLAEAKRLRAEKRKAKAAPRQAPTDDGAPQQRQRFKLIPWSDFAATPTADSWLVDKLLPRTGLAVLFGRSKSYKSFIALDVGVAVASDRPWAGRKVRAGIVVYVVCEGQGGFAKRIAAYMAVRPELATLDMFIVATRPDLGARPGDVLELIGSIRSALGEAVPVLIIVDTLVRTLNGREENGEGMRNFSDNAEDLAEAFGCLVIAVHHRGAGDAPRARGSTVLPGASVATWHVERVDNGDGGTARIEVMEAKDAASGLVFDVHLRRVEFGDEHDIERESTLIVESVELNAEKAERSQPAPKLPKRATEALLWSDALNDTLVDFPESSPMTTGYPNEPMTKVEHFKTALRLAGHIETLPADADKRDRDRVRQQWHRIRKDLELRRVLKIRGELCWRIDGGGKQT